MGELPHPPEQLWVCGTLPDPTRPFVCIVGSRACTRYGIEAVHAIIRDLDPSIYVVSGLAIGIDTEVHKACLKYGIKTIAFPGSGLDEQVLYPRSNIPLAKEIIEAGGCVVSEYDMNAKSLPWMFIKRNRLMAGVSALTVIIEAQEKSGTLVTARLATDYNREVGAVPGSIFSKTSTGANELIHAGATPIRSADDIHAILGLHTQASLIGIKTYDDCDEKEIQVIRAIEFLGECTKEDISNYTLLDSATLNTSLSMLEIKGYVQSLHNRLSLTK